MKIGLKGLNHKGKEDMNYIFLEPSTVQWGDVHISMVMVLPLHTHTHTHTYWSAVPEAEQDFGPPGLLFCEVK
jgi:hypothetical protein